jgi:hypothetical protein
VGGTVGVYMIGDKWYVDLYIDGRGKRKAIGNRKEAENALTVIKADVLRGEFKFKRESKVHFEVFAQDYLSHCKTNKRNPGFGRANLKSSSFIF